MDLHSPQIQGFFKIPVDHLYAMPVLVDYFRKADPRPGRGLARRRLWQAGVQVRRADERAGRLRQQDPARPRREGRDARHHRPGRWQERPDRRRLHDLRRHADRDGHRLQGARRKDIYACVSHGVFSKGSAAKLAPSPIKELVLTDTIGYRFEPLAPCCKVVSVAGLFAEAILSIHRRESVSRPLQLLTPMVHEHRSSRSAATVRPNPVHSAASAACHVDFLSPAA